MRLVLFVLAIGVITVRSCHSPLLWPKAGELLPAPTLNIINLTQITSFFSMIASSQPHWIEQTLNAPAPITKLRISYGLVRLGEVSPTSFPAAL